MSTIPPALGRGIVVPYHADLPAEWSQAPTIEVVEHVLGDPERTEALVDELHMAWITRTPTVIRWGIDEDTLQRQETTEQPVHTLTPGFLFPHERIRFLSFANNYDDRRGDRKWWWTLKAERLGVGLHPDADAALEDGTPVWIDGGPRSPEPLVPGAVVLHGEDVDAGRVRPLESVAEVDDPRLAPDQLGAVNHGSGAARIVAPAGSGKTRTLTARARHLLDGWQIHPQQLVAVAYNRRAAEELRQRIGVGAVDVRTIHSLGWAILNEARPGVSLIGELDARNHINHLVRIPKRPNTDPTGPYLEALDEVRSGLKDPIDVEAERDDVPGFVEAFDAYRSRLISRNEADHGEQVYGAIEVLLRRPDIRARWQQKCRHLLVDEFQDLTPAYLLLLRLLAAPQLQVFGVGDDDQVIYGYAGADPGYLIDFDRYFPNARHLALEVNYRCAPSIVDATSHLLGYNTRRIEKRIRADRPPDHAPGLTVRRAPGGVLAVEAADAVEKWLASGTEPSEIAILSRVNSSLIPVKAALHARGIASNDLLTADSLNRTAVRALFAWIRLALAPEDMRAEDVIEAIRRPSRGLTTVARDLLTRRRTSLSDLAQQGTRLDGKHFQRWDAFVEDIEGAIDVADGGSARSLVDHLVDEVGLASAAHTLDAGRTSAARSSHHDDLVAVMRATALHDDAQDFISWLRQAAAGPTSPDGVTLSSVHRVKGMEWDRVITFGVDRGSMPHELSTDREEERRIFHVAITRARNEAVVLADGSRPSRFLEELDGSAKVEVDRPAVPRARRLERSIGTGPQPGDHVTLRGGVKGVVTTRTDTSLEVLLGTGVETMAAVADVVAVSPGNRTEARPHLEELLRDWRRGKSTELGVPAYVVLHDATIEEIAATAPTTERQLLAITGIGASKLEHYGDEILSIVDSTR